MKCEQSPANVNHNVHATKCEPVVQWNVNHMLANVNHIIYAAKCEPNVLWNVNNMLANVNHNSYAAKCEPYGMDCEPFVLWNVNHMLANVNHDIMLPNVNQLYYEMWTRARKCEPQYLCCQMWTIYDMECELIVL